VNNTNWGVLGTQSTNLLCIIYCIVSCWQHNENCDSMCAWVLTPLTSICWRTTRRRQLVQQVVQQVHRKSKAYGKSTTPCHVQMLYCSLLYSPMSNQFAITRNSGVWTVTNDSHNQTPEQQRAARRLQSVNFQVSSLVASRSRRRTVTPVDQTIICDLRHYILPPATDNVNQHPSTVSGASVSRRTYSISRTVCLRPSVAMATTWSQGSKKRFF